MKHLFLIFLFLPVCCMSFSQAIRVLDENEYYKFDEYPEEFHFISPDFDRDLLERVAVLEGFYTLGKKGNIIDLFYAFWDYSNEMGANSFSVEGVDKSFSDSIGVKISVYFLPEILLKNNYDLYPENGIYVHGDVDNSKPKGRGFKLNKDKITLLPMEYIFYQNQAGEEAGISIGGMFGSKRWITGKKGRLPVHLSLSGFAVGGVNNYRPGTVALSFSTGGIHEIDMNIGQFLAFITDRKE